MNNNPYVWVQAGGKYTKQPRGFEIFENGIPKGIYTIGQSQNGYFLQLFLEEEFKFDFKIYGEDEDASFINHIYRTYQHSNGNLGILLNGIKGTGKTITAKRLANKFNLPVIIVDDPNTLDFLRDIDFPCTIFLDEYEKNFDTKSEEGSRILSIMDGVYNTSRKIFILTTNRINIDDNLLSRPSRIRYKKEFKGISKKVIREYIEDNLQDKSLTRSVCKFFDKADIQTIDILKAITDEFNIHGDCSEQLGEWFNIERKRIYLDCIIKRNMTSNGYITEEEANYNLDKFVKECELIGTQKPDGSIWGLKDFGMSKSSYIDIPCSIESLSPGTIIWNFDYSVVKIQGDYIAVHSIYGTHENEDDNDENSESIDVYLKIITTENPQGTYDLFV